MLSSIQISVIQKWSGQNGKHSLQNGLNVRSYQTSGFFNQTVLSEARVIQQLRVDQVGRAFQNKVRQDFAGGGGMHDTVAAGIRWREKSINAGRRAEHGVVVRRHFVEPGPGSRRIHGQFLEYGDAIDGTGEQDSFDEGAVESGFEAGLFFGIVPRQQEPQAFGPEMKAAGHIDHHGRRCATTLSKGSVGTSMRRRGSTGRSMPASFAVSADQAPAAALSNGACRDGAAGWFRPMRRLRASGGRPVTRRHEAGSAP